MLARSGFLLGDHLQFPSKHLEMADDPLEPAPWPYCCIGAIETQIQNCKCVQRSIAYSLLARKEIPRHRLHDWAEKQIRLSAETFKRHLTATCTRGIIVDSRYMLLSADVS